MNLTREWVVLAAPRREVKNRFKNFLRTYVDAKGNNLYFRLIQDMCSLNKSSFEVIIYPNSILSHVQVNLSFKCLEKNFLRFERKLF